MNRHSYIAKIENRNSKSGKILALAIMIPGLIGLTASDTIAQKVTFGPSKVVRFNPQAPANTVGRVPAPTIGQNRALLKNAGNAAVDKRVAASIAQNRQLLQNSGDAALKNRKMIAQAREAAKTSKNLRRATIAGTGVGLVLVGGVWIAESLVGDSPDDIVIDAAASIAEGKRLDKVVNEIGKRVDPARLAKNAKRNLDKTGRDVSKAFNFIGGEMKKIRL